MAFPRPARIAFAFGSLAPLVAAQSLFEGVRYEVGFIPRQLLRGDMQGDGKLDCVCLGETGQLNVFLAVGDGTFVPTGAFASYETATDAVLVDADLDGDLDALTVHGATSTPVVEGRLVVLHGNGQGALTKVQEIATGGITRGIARGDFDANGWPDYATVNSQSVSYSVLDGLPGGTVAAPTVYSFGAYMYEAEVADIGADGVLDMVAVGQGQLFLFSGDGQGGLFHTGSVPIAASANGLVIGKIDLDAKPDVGYVAGTTLRVISDVFGAPSETSYPVGGSCLDLAFGDFDANGRPDALTGFIDKQCALLYGNAAGGFGAATAFGVDVGVTQVDALDLDADGQSDALAAGNFALVVAHGTPSGLPHYSPATTIDVASYGTVSGLHGTDVDGDGDADVLLSGSSTLAWLAGDASGALAAPTPLAALSAPWDIDSGDLDGDGVLDVVVANEIGSFGHSVVVLRGLGGGAYAAPITHPAGSLPVDVALGDLDLDGDLDVACAALTSGLVVLIGASGVDFAAQEQYTEAGTGDRVQVGDFDANGKPDVVLSGSAGLLRYSGDGAGGLAAPLWIATGNNLDRRVVQADFNRDGRTDLATYASPSAFAGLRVHLADGSAGYLPPILLGALAGVTDLLAADVDADGNADLVCWTNHGNAGVRLGDGAAGFGALHAYGSPASNGRGIAGADLDADGRIDVVTGMTGKVVELVNLAPDAAFAAPYGTGTPDCEGATTLGATAMPQVGASGFALFSANAPAGVHGFLVVAATADAAGSDPLGLGLLLHFSPFAPWFSVGAHTELDGSAHVPLPIPADAALGGQSLAAQALWLQPLAPCSGAFAGLSSSRGLSLQIQP